MTYIKNPMKGLMLGAGLLLLASCGGDDGTGIPDPTGGVVEELAKSCGIDVECTSGLAQGNASISGVASVDAFFKSVLNFEAKADGVSGAVDAELRAIAADFGIEAGADIGAALEAGIKAQIEANVDGELTVEAEPARCAVDAQATLEAQAECDAEFDPGSAMVMCEGGCEVEASADVQCSGSAMLECTVTAPSVECMGECKGSCNAELMAAAECSGTCHGSCSGSCSAYVKNTEGELECSGSCDGMCEGSCEVELGVAATCEGTCEGECTVQKPDGGCEGGIRAECKGEANAMVECDGKCTGEFEPPMAKAECQASAKAEAKLNVECTPPRLAVSYRLQAGANVDVDAQARFVAAIENLKVRLPALLAASAKADLIVKAGEGLIADAKGAVEAGVSGAADAAGEGNLRVLFGLQCAVEALGDVEGTISGAVGRLSASASATAKLKGALGV